MENNSGYVKVLEERAAEASMFKKELEFLRFFYERSDFKMAIMEEYTALGHKVPYEYDEPS